MDTMGDGFQPVCLADRLMAEEKKERLRLPSLAASIIRKYSARQTQEDGVQGHLVILVWVFQATGAKCANGIDTDISMLIGCRLQAGQGVSGQCLSSTRDFNALFLELSLKQASMATRNEPYLRKWSAKAHGSNFMRMDAGSTDRLASMICASLSKYLIM
eukprot:1155687-Pelagomonas_calceolata.AAC.7